MKGLLCFLLLSLPACAQLRLDESGQLSLDYRPGAGINFVALEGRDQSGDSWRPLGHWSVTEPAIVRLETGPRVEALEYRLVLFGPGGFLSTERLYLNSAGTGQVSTPAPSPT